MTRLKPWLTLLSLFMATVTLGTDVKPLPLPKALRVESAGPRGKVWERLSAKQKKLAQHLINASRIGRMLLFHQAHRHAIVVKGMIESAFVASNLPQTKAMLGEEGF